MTKRRHTDIATSLTIGDIAVQVIRKRVKNINLRVRRDGSVVVSAPRTVSLSQIEAFVSSRADWIARAQERLARAAEQSGTACEEGLLIPLWGSPKTCHIEHVAAQDGKDVIRFAVEGDCLMAEVSGAYAHGDDASALRQQALEAWLRSKLITRAEELLPRYEEVVGARSSRLRFRKMVSRWGSCNVVTAAITLNTELVRYPQCCLEYVLVHELCHLHEPHHNAHFYQLVEQAFPGWQQARNMLKARGA